MGSYKDIFVYQINKKLIDEEYIYKVRKGIRRGAYAFIPFLLSI